MAGDNGYKRRGGQQPYDYGQPMRAEDFSEVQVALRRKRANAEADRMLANESWAPPDMGVSFAEELKDPPAPVRHIIEDLLPEGISMLAAQFKAGKTTLGLNLAASMVSGDNFLDWFELEQLTGNVGYWNMEVDHPQMFAWQEKIIRKYPEKMFTAHLRGKRMDLLHDAVAELTVKWLKGHDIESWILDPLGRMLDEENSSAAFNKWFQRLEQIVADAGVRATLIIHHSGHAGVGEGDAVPRARGASSMMGNTDCNLFYRHAGGLGEMPPDTLRFLSAFGRGVDVPEITLDYDESTRHLSADNSAPDRKHTKLYFDIDRAVQAVEEAGDWELNKTQLKAAMGGHAAGRDPAIDAAVRDGRLITKKIPGNKAVLYGLP